MSILLIDFEATDKDPKTARVIEIGAEVVNNDFSRINEPGYQFASLVHDSDYPELSEEVQKVTNITPAMLHESANTPQGAFHLLGDLITKDVEYAIAYNTAYDAVLFKEEMFRLNMSLNPRMSWLLNIPWLCAMTDIESNYAIKSWKQMHVALEYGITVNPKELHRAINDVELMRQILVESKTSAKAMHEFQNTPWIYLAAIVEKPWLDGGKSTDLAKAAGYSWESAKGDFSGTKFAKRWVKRIKEHKLDLEKQLPFQVERIEQ